MIYKVSDQFLFDLIQIEKLSSKVDKDNLSTKTLLELKQSAMIDELFYFAKKLNLKLTFGEAKQIAVGKILENSNIPEMKLIYNYRSLLDFMNQNNEDISMQLLVHMNKLLGNGILDIWECGMVRSTTTEINTQYDFYPATLKASNDQFVSEKSSRIVNAVKVLKYAIINKPFVGLNDATALAGFSIELMKFMGEGDFLFSPIKVLDEIDLPNEIYRDYEYLIDRVMKLVETKTKEVLQRIDRENYDESIRTKSKFLNLNERQLAALRYLEHNLKISRKQYMRLFSVSTMTAFRDMNQLVDQKIVAVEGKGRGTYYRLER